MTVAAVYRALPGAPPHARERLVALATTARDGEAVSFGEPARQALAGAADRVRAEMRGGELTECLAVMAHLQTGLAGLDPSALLTRRGLGGLFDSRRKRLRAFRRRFGDVTRTLAESLDDLQVRRGAIARRSGFADRLWEELRTCALEVDAHALAAAAAAGDDAEAPLALRARRLAEARDAAISILPQVRSGQNADAAAAERIRAVCDALMEWHTEWRLALGLDGQKGDRRGKPPSERIRPDQTRLTTSRETVLSMLSVAEREVETARKRRQEADGRIESARRRI